MKNVLLLFVMTSLIFLACTPKNGSKTTVTEDHDETPAPVKEEIPEKGPPPPLPAWAKFPARGAGEVEVKSAVQTLNLLVGPDVRVKVRPPYKVFQTGVLREENGNVMMPVRVARANFELVGLVDMFQVEVAVPGGTTLYDAPVKGTEVGFISAPIRVRVDKIDGDWAQVTHELNSSCSPVYLKVWVKKSAIMTDAKETVPFPAKYDKNAPKKELRKDAALFEIYGTAKSETSLISLPMCNNESQVLMTGTTSGARTQIFFKPTPTGPFAILGWMDKEIASGKLYSACTCGNSGDSGKSGMAADLQYDYKVRIRLPLYLSPDKKAEPVGAVEIGQVKRIVQFLKNPEFGKLEIEEGLGTEFFVPYHENYYEP